MAESVATAVHEIQAAEGAAPAVNGEDAPRNGRRSRDRYGRDRRNGRERNRDDAPATEATEGAPEAPWGDANRAAPAMDTIANMVDAMAPEAEQEAPRRSYFSQATPVAEAVAVTTPVQAPEAAPAVEMTAPVVAPVAAAAEVEVVQVAAPVAQAEVASTMPHIQAYTLPLASLQQLARDAGLEWVNSDADKVAAVQAAIAAEPKPVRIPRERPPVVVLDEGPLVLVETRKDLSAMVLPFEESANHA